MCVGIVQYLAPQPPACHTFANQQRMPVMVIAMRGCILGYGPAAGSNTARSTSLDLRVSACVEWGSKRVMQLAIHTVAVSHWLGNQTQGQASAKQHDPDTQYMSVGHVCWVLGPSGC
jgi:hypothetical protein